MKLSNLNRLKPVGLTIFLVLTVTVFPCVLLPFWINKVGTINQQVQSMSESLNKQILSEVQTKANLLAPLHSSATRLARIVQTYLNNETEMSFPIIESKVAPFLFEAHSTIPYATQVSYVGIDGLLFSYYMKENGQPIAVYSNASTTDTWYSQAVNNNTGKCYGDAVTIPSRNVGIPFIRSPSLGTAWTNDKNLLFINSANVFDKGTISLGYQVNLLVGLFSGIASDGRRFYLATKEGDVLSEGMIPHTRITFDGDLVAFQLLNSRGVRVGEAGNITCQPHGDNLRAQYLRIWETNYMLYCSPLKIAGLDLVYVVAIPYEESMESLMHQNFTVSLVLIGLMIATVFVVVASFVVIIVQENRRVMRLRSALMKQMDATQQSERKSMKKSSAYANASHDVRASLAGITGLIEICKSQVGIGSELEASLVQMESCTRDLLGILNSILDTSKIESGKVELEEEEFVLPQLLEDVADLFHSVGMRKGVDVVLDLSDGSVAKFSSVKGDRVKLKQILCNLVSNAVKFTSEGYVSIRAYARKPSFERLASSTKSNPLQRLLSLFRRNQKAHGNDNASNLVQEDENVMEFVFEVDDTGKGIPKEKIKSVFEDYVQVKETAHGQEGTGLGLGIVQSLVRLMCGEIMIVDKGVNEKGTCFKFNTYLKICQPYGGKEYDIESCNEPSRLSIPAPEASHVVLFIESEERLKVTKSTMQRRGINVSATNSYELFCSTLKYISKKLLICPNITSDKFEDDSTKTDCLSRAVSRNSSTTKRKTSSSSSRTVTSNILIVADRSSAIFSELGKAVDDFRKELSDICCRVVWIDRPGTDQVHQQYKFRQTDQIIYKPFHGSRLDQVIRLLPEFGGMTAVASVQSLNVASEASTSAAHPTPTIPTQVKTFSSTNDKPLGGKKVLLAEDDMVLQKIGTAVLSKLGATVQICVNGQEAYEVIRKALSDQRNSEPPDVLPYDFVFMDCEMPIMNGFEATQRIRAEEEHYGLHIPIIAVSAHTDGPELKRMLECGMDRHMPKPLNATKLVQVLADVTGSN